MAEIQMALENERESEEEGKKEEKDHQYFEDLKQQIEGNAIRRKADHDLEERRAQTEFDQNEAWNKRQMVIEDKRESDQERKKEQKDHQYGEDLKQQIAGNVVRRKAEHDVEERRAKTEFSGGFEDEAWLAEEAEERKNIDEEHAPPPIGDSQAGVVERDDWPIGRKGVDSRYTTHHTNFQTKRQMVIEDERESEQERKKEQKDHQYGEDLKQQIGGNVVRRKAEHDVEERRAKTDFSGEFDDESWLAKEAEERKHIVEHSQAGVVKHDDLPVERKGADDREGFSDRPHRFASRNDQRESTAEGHAPPPIGYSQAGVVERDDWPIGRKGVDSRYTTHHTNFQTKRQMVIEDERESEQERKKEEKDHQYVEDLKEQIAGNVVRRKAEHDVEERRAKTEFGGEFDDESWLAKEAEERKHIVEHSQAGVVKHDDLPVERKGADDREGFSDRPHRFASRNDQRESTAEGHAPPPIGYSQAGVVERDDWPIGRKGVDSRYTTHHTNFQTKRQMVIEDERESEQERKKEQKDHQYGEDLKQRVAGNVVRRKAEHDVEVRRAKTEFSGGFDNEAWLAEEAEERKHDDLRVGRKGAEMRDGLATLDVGSMLAISNRPYRFAKSNGQYEAEKQMALEDEKESEEERKEERDHQYGEDLKQQIAGNVVRRKAEHDVEERRAKTEFSGGFDDESWLAEEAEERKNIVE